MMDDPQAYLFHKRKLNAIQNGQFVDVHDAVVPDPKDYDVLLSDADDAKLRTDIADVVGITYLSEATEEDAHKMAEVGECYLWGLKIRTLFPTVVRINDHAFWVFFVVNSGSSITYLSAQVSYS